MAARALNSMRSVPSCLSSPTLRTTSRTPGFNPTTQTTTPRSVARCSYSIKARNAEYSMSGTRLMSTASTRGLCCATSALICSPTFCPLAKYRRPSGRTIRRPGKVSSSGCSGDSGRSTSAARLRPMTDTRGCAVWLAETDHRCDDRHHNPIERSEQQHTERGDDRPPKLHAAHLADRKKLPG